MNHIDFIQMPSTQDRPRRYLGQGALWDLNDAYITMPGMPSSAEVQHWAANRPSVAVEQRKVPLWALVCLWAGLALLLGFAMLAVSVAYLVMTEGAFL